MKKIALAVVLLTAISTSKAQERNNICVWNAINTYTEGGSHDDLERAVKCSDEAIANETTNTKYKVWLYRGELFTKLFQDTVTQKTNVTAALEAAKAFRKLYDIADPKFKDWDEAYTYMFALSNQTYTKGAAYYTAKNYAQAYQFFGAVVDLDRIILAKKKVTNVGITDALKAEAVSAEQMGDKKAAITVYKEWIIEAPNSYAYLRLALNYKADKDTDDYVKIVDEGLGKYPKDGGLLVEKINTFLAIGKYQEALSYVNTLIDLDPKNDMAYMIKALAYDRVNNEDSVIYYNTKAITVNPKNKDAHINLAAVYVNKANPLIEEMNKLGNSAADSKKFSENTIKVKELYLKAQPLLVAAKALDPSETQVTRTLTKINAFLLSNK